MNSATYDVAIIGFGPTGAVAAALLGQAGLRVHVCDRLRGVYEFPRALAMDHEIMRVFQQLGAVQSVAPHVEPFTPSEYRGVDGQLIRRMTMVAPPYPQGYTPSLVFSQPPVERALRERVAQLPNVTVALGTELCALRPDDSAEVGAVTLEMQSEGGCGAARTRTLGDRLATAAPARCVACWAPRWKTWTSTNRGWWRTCA